MCVGVQYAKSLSAVIVIHMKGTLETVSGVDTLWSLVTRSMDNEEVSRCSNNQPCSCFSLCGQYSAGRQTRRNRVVLGVIPRTYALA